METLSLRIQLRGETIVVETGKLPEPARLDHALPALKAVDDRAIEMAIRISPKPVTCAKGCSMCCRIQLVPVSPAEAYALWLLVDGLPEPRRSEILARFSDRADRLDEAGLTHVFLNGDLALDSEAARDPVTKYLGLGLICPFLEDDACGIYQFRPFSCREFLVTTPKEMCADPLSQPVERLPLVLFPGKAAADSASAISGCPHGMIPLILALKYVEMHREELERTYPSGPLLAHPIQRALAAAYRAGQ